MKATQHRALVALALIFLPCISASDAVSAKSSYYLPSILTRPQRPHRNHSKDSYHQSIKTRSSIECITKLRGGTSASPYYYEANPRYQDSPTLGDVTKDGFYHAKFPSPLQSYRYEQQEQRPPSLIQAISNYFGELQRFSPTLFYGFITSILLHILWQFQSSSKLLMQMLRNHFVCSHYNVLRKRRYHALLLSAFSHASFHHIAVNMYAYVTFGRSVKQLLASHGLPLWIFVVSAALFGNIVFLLFDKGGGGSCVGLSGVTLALLAFDALVYPTKELRMIVSFIPITLPAYYLFLGLLGFSILGICGLAGSDGVAHSTHLGGLVYGAMFYEAFKRGWLRQYNYRARKVYLAFRGHS